jgi:glycosyltransferase involved in cell wall biosynthesis
MKTLVSTLIWVPEGSKERAKTVAEHLRNLVSYTGDFDVLLVNNGIHDQSLYESLNGVNFSSNITEVSFKENRGWNIGRNYMINYAMEHDYDLLIMMDCDIICTNKDWITSCQKGTEVCDAFMVRYSEPPMREGSMNRNGLKWDIYVEWYGCINVVTRKAMEVVGGYDLVTFPEPWGYSDCEYGRRLAKAKMFGALRAYPSLSGMGAVNLQDNEKYAFSPEKDRITREYKDLFWETHRKVNRGEKPVFFDYKINL